MTWLPVCTVRKTTAGFTLLLGGGSRKTRPQGTSQVWHRRSINAGHQLVYGQFWWHFDLFRLILTGVLWRLIQTGKRTVPWSLFLRPLPPSVPFCHSAFFFSNWSMCRYWRICKEEYWPFCKIETLLPSCPCVQLHSLLPVLRKSWLGFSCLGFWWGNVSK